VKGVYKMLDVKIGFIGAGKMGSALIRGLIKTAAVRPQNVVASDLETNAREKIAKEGIQVFADNREVAKNASVIFLAVKPDAMFKVITDIKEVVTQKHLVVSIAAGVPLEALEAALGEGSRVIRVMPNTPALVGEMAAAFSLGKNATDEDGKLLQKILGALGAAVQVDEGLMDAVTGLSGSGPAYIFLVIEALADGGVKAGLPRDVALRLATQTALGAAKMVVETGEHPERLKDMVASPGGTTIEGLAVLEKKGVRGAFIQAVEKAARKSRSLAKAGSVRRHGPGKKC
jgi:pyrroline-5-carboxylate reductase